MLREFMLKLAMAGNDLVRFRQDLAAGISHAGLSTQQQDALRKGDLHGLRGLLHQELVGRSSADEPTPPDTQSEYDVHNVPTTPHIPIDQGASLDPSFWSFCDPVPLFDSRGLTVVGTGIRGGLQTTAEARICIEQAPRVLYLVADPITEAWIRQLNPRAQSLTHFYERGKRRIEIYGEIVDYILDELRTADELCVAFYGHPGEFVYVSREAMRRARAEGIPARMLPGISTAANLYADLGVDPGLVGMQSYEATSFLVNRYRFDPSAALILWQLGVLGETRWEPGAPVRRDRLELLAGYLSTHYGSDHEVVLYEASELPGGNARIERVALRRLGDARIVGVATLFVPPKAPPSADSETVRQLQLGS